ncbi:glutaredoxin 3 [Hahella sp. CCB-MM4]|uniref:glutaredoxin 3 n=1 Tax=Hahella sp. (strain CCB-MM4) TaxID=1926491 RepID=UPI000B9A2A28|nr:glutaredoxin 3 [Hahella sp. CCB-MM4]OZG71783.1 glutaredoxin 3 [Hahella sp. CCB-MM4]
MSQNKPVTIYTTQFCPYCIRAKRLLESKEVGFDEIKVDFDAAKRGEMTERSGRRTVPQIWIGDQHIGGCDELYALERAGSLDGFLAE